MEQDFLEVDGVTNAIDYLEMIHHFLTKVDSEWKWKWIILATHQALYSFGLCALAGTSTVLTVTDRGKDGKKLTKTQKVAQAHAYLIEGDDLFQIAQKLNITTKEVESLLKTKPKLLSIKQVLERLKDKKYLRSTNSRPLKLKLNEQQALSGLTKSFRNEFEHYNPHKTWRIETKLVASMINDCLPVIEFIAVESNSIVYTKGKSQRIKKAFDLVKVSLTTILEGQEDATSSKN